MAVVNRRRILMLLLCFSAAALVAGLHAMPVDGGTAGGATQTAASNPPAPDSDGCRRIVSLSPSLTEVLFALGLGSRVVGVTRYCDHPAEALEKAKVGGCLDPNYEAMVALRPDLVVMLVEHEEPRAFMKQRGIGILVCNHRTLGGIRQSIEKIGAACGGRNAAADILDRIDRTVDQIRDKTRGLDRPRVLIAAAVAQGAALMLLDEPATFLDPAHQAEVFAVLDRLNREKGVTVVAVTHDINAALLFSRRVLALKNGKIFFDGSPARMVDGGATERIYGIPFVRLAYPEQGKRLLFPRIRP